MISKTTTPPPLSTNPSIPIIDLSPFTSSSSSSSSSEDRLTLAKSLVHALRINGFLYITNHGIPSSTISEAFAMSKRLFDLSVEEKMLAPHPKDPEWHRGYSGVGMEKVSQTFVSTDEEGRERDKKEGKRLRGVRDVKESYEIGSESCKGQPPIWLPEPTLPHFRTQTTDLYWRLAHLSDTVLSVLALGLGLPSEDYFKQFHSGHNNQLRLLHYPSVPAAEIEQGRAERMPAHTDWGSITFLFQDDVGGLQVEDCQEKGRFVDVEGVEGAVVVNVGDLMMRWSNDTLKSTMHRVTLPPLSSRFEGEERMTRERYSIPYFVAPDSDAVVECLKECIPEGEKAKYEPIAWDQYRRMRAGLQYERE